MDWQSAMENTEMAAKAASLKADRTVGAVAQLLQTQRQHSSSIRELKLVIESQSAHSEVLRGEMENFLAQPKNTQGSCPWAFLGAFLGGVACGGFLLS